MQALHKWFLQNRRDFPWRTHPTPYRVWISEVMLQQTRAAVVIPYFLRWMELFPDIPTLAASPIESVIKAWEGLGYYSRVRNLHAAAKQIMDEFGGKLPDTAKDLLKLKGLGSYTVGAILSFGFHKKAAAVDGNVVRVLSRYLAIEENVSLPSVRKKIEQKTEQILDEKEPWMTTEALIELGAVICTPRPRCEDCPLRGNCLALQSGKVAYLPIKDQPAEVTELHRIVPVILAEGKVLLKKGEPGKIMADLYEFPYFEKDKEFPWGLKLKDSIALTKVQHTFTRYKAHLYPRLFRLIKAQTMDSFLWVSLETLPELPFSSGHRKIVKELLNLSQQ